MPKDKSALEREGLEKHGFPVEEPNELSDAFCLGVRWALVERPSIHSLRLDQHHRRARFMTKLTVSQLCELEGTLLVNSRTLRQLEGQALFKQKLNRFEPMTILKTGVVGRLKNLSVVTDEFAQKFIFTPILIEPNQVRFLELLPESL